MAPRALPDLDYGNHTFTISIYPSHGVHRQQDSHCHLSMSAFADGLQAVKSHSLHAQITTIPDVCHQLKPGVNV
jgi:hypothetical protein